MLDVAIVGGGLSGLVLADGLNRNGRRFSLFEARARLGGRIESVWSEKAKMRVDVGPTWFWPQTQPALSALISELELEIFAQYETGEVLHLRDPDKVPDVELSNLHDGARRLSGGMASLVEALTSRIPQSTVHLSHELTSVKDCGDYVQLVFLSGGQMVKVTARTVVLAIPPRLLKERVVFEPELPEDLSQAMESAQTWMASSAKVVLGYERPFWRESGLAGNAFVSHGQAMLCEIHDACDASAGKAALAGFLALSPDDRELFTVGLPMLMSNQLGQVFGAEAETGQQHYRDWAREPFTCSPRDRAEVQAETTGTANPLLRRALWQNKLHFAGSEVAVQGAGYMEGAVQAADRARSLVLKALSPGIPSTGDVQGAFEGLSGNARSLAQFASWVDAQTLEAFDRYRANLTERLSSQERDQLTQRSVLDAFETTLDLALTYLGQLEFNMAGIPVENGRSALMSDIQAPFRNLLETLMEDVTSFNRTSCALSNFPYEHHLSNEYRQTILRDLAAVWREFSLAANRLLLSRVRVGNRFDG